MNNPFQPPQAKIAEHPERSLEPRFYFVPWQVFLVGCFGGPIALLHMIRSNEVRLGRLAWARNSLLIGIVLCVLAVYLLRERNSLTITGTIYFGLTLLAVAWVQFRQMPMILAESDPELGILTQEWPTLFFTVFSAIGFSLLLGMIVASALQMLFPMIY